MCPDATGPTPRGDALALPGALSVGPVARGRAASAAARPPVAAPCAARPHASGCIAGVSHAGSHAASAAVERVAHACSGGSPVSTAECDDAPCCGSLGGATSLRALTSHATTQHAHVAHGHQVAESCRIHQQIT